MKRVLQGALLSLLLLLVGIIAIPSLNQRSYRWFLQRALNPEVPVTRIAELATLKGAVLLDARAQEEYTTSHLPEARWFGYPEMQTDALAGLAKDQPIVVYCSVGVRSERMALKLRELGYTKVSNLYGGLFAWVNKGLPVLDARNQPTRQVHAYNRMWGVWLREGEKVY
ncbi:MAG: rhodanese-like domain-containing protein [Salibacteraceae bacterium]